MCDAFSARMHGEGLLHVLCFTGDSHMKQQAAGNTEHLISTLQGYLKKPEASAVSLLLLQ